MRLHCDPHWLTNVVYQNITKFCIHLVTQISTAYITLHYYTNIFASLIHFQNILGNFGIFRIFMFNKLEKTRMMRKPLRTLSLNKSELSNLWVEKIWTQNTRKIYW